MRANQGECFGASCTGCDLLELADGQEVFTLVTHGRFLDVGVKSFNIEPNGGNFDIRTKNDRASPIIKSSIRLHCF